MPNSRPHVVIIGGGFAGLNVARGLGGLPMDVTLIDRHNYHLFQPLLYQVAMAVLSPGDIATPIRAILSRERNVKVLFAEARAIVMSRRLVLLDEGEVHYDYLVLATGASHAYFGHDEWAPLAPGLKTLDDALEIRRRVLLAFERAEREADTAERSRLLTFVVVGAGPTGVELAGALSDIARQALVRDFRSINPASARVLLLEGGPRVLPTFPEHLSQAAARSLAQLGVEVRTGAMVTDIGKRGVTVGEECIAAGTILWAAGVRASPLAQSLGVAMDRAGRVPVDRTLTLPGHPELFVLGDLALAMGPDGQPLPGLAAVAMQQGVHTAQNIRRAVKGQPMTPFRYRNLGNLATIGRSAAVADFGRVQLTGFLAWMAWLLVHLWKLIGFRNRVIVFVEWAWAYVASRSGVRLITNDDRIWNRTSRLIVTAQPSRPPERPDDGYPGPSSGHPEAEKKAVSATERS
ncbi:MAG: NAD(P)/FAD-dependent oxidoreductase [Bacteroidales bacterium]